MKKISIFLLLIAPFLAVAQKIYVTNAMALSPIVEGGSTVKMMLALDALPSSDVTVSITSRNGYFSDSGDLTFTTSNYNIPDTVTLSATSNGTTDGIRYDYAVISATGGGYNTSRVVKVRIVDTGVDSAHVRGYPGYSTALTTVASIASARSAFNAEIWNGNGLPTIGYPDTLTPLYSGAMHQTSTSSVTGVFVDKLTYNKLDNAGYKWTNRVYHIRKNGGSGTKICMVSGGHGSEGNHLQMIQELIDDDVDVLYVAMPITFQNTEANPTINSAGVGGHNDIKTGGLDNGTYNPLELFFFDKIRALNYVDSAYNYTQFYVAGCSGGGWTATVLAAMDTRFSKAFDIRGITPMHYVHLTANADYEQGGITSKTTFTTGEGNSSTQLTSNYNAINYFDICLLASSGGRELHMLHQSDDSCCHGTFVYNLFVPRLSIDAATLGGSIQLYLMTDPANSNHSFNTLDRVYVISKV